MADDDSSPETRTCTTCGKDKTLHSFEKGRRQCHSCRHHARADKRNAESRAWYWRNQAARLISMKAWRDENPETVKAVNKTYREAHQEERSLANKTWMATNQEHRRNYNQAWAEDHKEERRLYNQSYNAMHRVERALTSKAYNATHRVQRTHVQSKRRARQQQLPSTFTYGEEQWCRQYFAYACAVCGREESFDCVIGIDHWIPLSAPACPGSIATNLVPLCHGVDGCNNSKHNKDPQQWLVSRFGTRKTRQILARIETYFAIVHQRFSVDKADNNV